MKVMKLSLLACLLLLISSYDQLVSSNQIDNLNKLIRSRKSANPPNAESWDGLDVIADDHDHQFSPVYVEGQGGSKKADKIGALPGQPQQGVDFDQYAGYLTVDKKGGTTLFYYFVESPKDSSTKPLVLWLNGGPGCSSFGYGAMEELGPFRVNSDGNTLFRNEYAWNNVANVLFLESPAGVGFSYSNTTSQYVSGDKKTAEDAYKFVINWLQRFPEYKTRDFFITGESYAGHYVPQLAYTILKYNKVTNQTKINLKGIAIGNAWIDDATGELGIYDYLWTHAMNSDETNAGIHKYCNFSSDNYSSECAKYRNKAREEAGDIDIYNIYAPLCKSPSTTGSVNNFDSCSDNYVSSYLNLAEVQAALHVKPTSWAACGGVRWTDSPKTILPTVKQLMDSGLRLWIYSGDIDGRVPVTSSRYAINTLKLPLQTPWRPWYSNGEVGGYVIAEYKGLTFTTIRGAGHEVPSYQPQRSLTFISSFLEGKLPPSS